MNKIKIISLLVFIPFIIAPACGSWTDVYHKMVKPKPVYLFHSIAGNSIDSSAIKERVRFKYLITLTKGSTVRKPDSWENRIKIELKDNSALKNALRFNVVENDKIITHSSYMRRSGHAKAHVFAKVITPAKNNCSGNKQCTLAVTCDASGRICKKEIMVDVYLDANRLDHTLPAEKIYLVYEVLQWEDSKYAGASLTVVSEKL